MVCDERFEMRKPTYLSDDEFNAIVKIEAR